MKILIFILGLMIGPTLLGQESAFSISFGPVHIGNSRIILNLQDFKVAKKLNSDIVTVKFIENSVQWIRNKNNLLTPRARVGIFIKTDSEALHLKYHGRSIIPQTQGQQFYAEFYVDLFDSSLIEVIDRNNIIDKLYVYSDIKNQSQNTKLIDYSCVKYRLEITGMNDDYVSVGCRLEKVGSWGNERPFLEVTWTATNIKLIDGTAPPFTTFLKDSSPITLIVTDLKGREKKISIKAQLPKKLHRLNFAYGFGPTVLNAQTPNKKTDWRLAPVLYLYGKFDISKHTSLRAFDALAFNKAVFNNSGLYFAYQLADMLDGRLELVPLLGIQGLYFDYGEKDTRTQNDLIFPQGFELNYKNAFGIENYLVSFGLFLSTQSKVEYTNTWIRWGSGPFWEFNYIKWGQNGYLSEVAGFSVGLPLASFF